jgi:hypothetical protein
MRSCWECVSDCADVESLCSSPIRTKTAFNASSYAADNAPFVVRDFWERTGAGAISVHWVRLTYPTTLSGTTSPHARAGGSPISARMWYNKRPNRGMLRPQPRQAIRRKVT